MHLGWGACQPTPGIHIRLGTRTGRRSPVGSVKEKTDIPLPAQFIAMGEGLERGPCSIRVGFSFSLLAFVLGCFSVVLYAWKMITGTWKKRRAGFFVPHALVLGSTGARYRMGSVQHGWVL